MLQESTQITINGFGLMLACDIVSWPQPSESRADGLCVFDV